MVEADHRLSLRLHSARVTLARQAASKAVKLAFQRQGIKLANLSHRDICIAAEDYLAKHRDELLAEAAKVVDRWQRNGFFGKKAQRAWAQCAELTSHAQRERA
jgi:hypothetical protein